MLALASLANAAPKDREKTAVEKVTDVRFWTAGDTTRVAIEVSGEFHYKSERLTGPDRVFFDLSETQVVLKDGRPSIIPVKDGLVKQVRLAEKQPGTVRVVLDLENGVEYTVSQLSNPERLMVELKAGSKTTSSRPANPKVRDTSNAEPGSGPSLPLPPAQDPKQAPAHGPAAPPATKVSLELKPVETVSTAKSAPETKSPIDTQLALLIPPVFASIAGTAPTSTSAPAYTAVAANVAPRPVAIPEPPPLKDLPKDIVPLDEPKAAARNSNGERSMTRVLGLKLSRIVLDPGHGGHDQGTHSKAGMLEKDLVLDVTNRLAELLRTRLGTEVVLTRSDDTFLSLEERTRLANEAKADLFLSIHANSSPVKSVAGVETFYLNFSTGRDDLDFVTRENASTQRSISDLKEVVSKIMLRAKVDESREFALRIQKSLQTTAVKQNKDAKDRGVKRAPFVVLIGADMPSVLAEIGFLSNSRDEALLKGPEHRDRIAEALYNGIAGYADSLSKTTQIARSGH